MTRRKNPDDHDGHDLDREEFGARALTRKAVLDMMRRREDFTDADLRGLDLSGLVFDGLNLRNAKFAESNLTRCSFRGANLSGASFFGAQLKDAILDEANLEDADLDFAWLDGVTLRAAKVRKALFPLDHLKLADIHESVRTGRRLSMERSAVDDAD